ncbi:MAG TPA: MBOAT family protein [Planctomycetes bacterium]|nr:MBOAT family protein [Planctomycetota bacterium]
MVFNSLTFLLFFAAVLVIDRVLKGWRARKVHLLIASYLFYAAWNPPFVLLLWLSTVVDWYAARGISSARSLALRRSFLALSLATNLGLLACFKYGGFLLENLESLLEVFGVVFQPATFSVVLPVGISFYTFQTLSYTIDVYRGKTVPSSSFLDFALYVTFFPQLVAGPIVRSTEFLPQCLEAKRANGQQVGWGLTLLALGLVEKVVIADGVMARIADQVYASSAPVSFLDAWAGTFAFSWQIFFDFAGYSTCAIGAALCLGFALPDNFRFPYAAVGFSDFWRRWHISLSSWLRDYLYIPLGGNRRGAVRTRINLMLTMLIGGLWHGAAWRFVIWGGLHGFYLGLERLVMKMPISRVLAGKLWMRPLVAVATFGAVCVAWVFFRAETLPAALRMCASMGSPGARESLLDADQIAATFGGTALLLYLQWKLRDTTLESVAARMPGWLLSLVLLILLLLLYRVRGDSRAFIYFQF